jgi:hypothetical protein
LRNVGASLEPPEIAALCRGGAKLPAKFRGKTVLRNGAAAFRCLSLAKCSFRARCRPFVAAASSHTAGAGLAVFPRGCLAKQEGVPRCFTRLSSPDDWFYRPF